MKSLQIIFFDAIPKNFCIVFDKLIFFAGETIWFYYNKSNSDFLIQKQLRVENESSSVETWSFLSFE